MLSVDSQLTPILSSPCAAFINGDSAGKRAVGAFFGVVLPAIFLAMATYLIIVHVSLLVPGRTSTAVYIVSDNPAATVAAHEDGGEVATKPPPQRWYIRYILGPIFGYRPADAGTWVDNRPGGSFVGRYGALFESVKGPRMQRVRGTFRRTPTGLDRGRLEHAGAGSRARRAREVAQLLGVVVTLLKAVLFADVLAGMASGVAPLVPVVLLISLGTLFWIYLRLLVPWTGVVDLTVEAVISVLELGTFAGGIVVAVTPPSNTAVT
jgi:hypothetical protein